MDVISAVKFSYSHSVARRIMMDFRQCLDARGNESIYMHRGKKIYQQKSEKEIAPKLMIGLISIYLTEL